MVMIAEINETLNVRMARALVIHFSCAKVMVYPVMRNNYKEYDRQKASGAILTILTPDLELMNEHGLCNADPCASS